MEGCKVGPLNELAPWGQFFSTATARERVVGAEAFDLMADGAVLGNCGHFDTEIDVAALRARRLIQASWRHDRAVPHAGWAVAHAAFRGTYGQPRGRRTQGELRSEERRVGKEGRS